MSNLLDTLKKLKSDNDGHWTNDGLPRLDVLSKALGREVTREELTATVPGFSRVTADELGAADAADDAGTAPHVPTPAEQLPEAVHAAADAGPAPDLEDGSDMSHEALSARRSELTELIGHHATQATAHLEARDAAQNELARLNVTANGVGDANYAGQVSAFLASERRMRAERVAGAHALKAAGINPAELLKMISPAPVDARRAAQPNAMRLRG